MNRWIGRSRKLIRNYESILCKSTLKSFFQRVEEFVIYQSRVGSRSFSLHKLEDIPRATACSFFNVSLRFGNFSHLKNFAVVYELFFMRTRNDRILRYSLIIRLPSRSTCVWPRHLASLRTHNYIRSNRKFHVLDSTQWTAYVYCTWESDERE